MSRRKYTKEILEEAVSASESFAGVVRYLGLKQAGGTQSNIARSIRDLGIDHSHFTGQGHNKGKRSPLRKTPEDIFVVLPEGSCRTKGNQLRRALLETGVPEVCESCGIGVYWNNSPLVLEVDHIDGDFLNNLKDNLRFICPNCHSQTETSRSWKNTRGYGETAAAHGLGPCVRKDVGVQLPLSLPRKKRKIAACVDCASEVRVGTTRCKPCENINRRGTNTKIEWPDHQELVKMVESSNFSAVGRKLGVSDNAIRKRLKTHN